MKCDYCGHKLCCCPCVICPHIIFGPGVREHSREYIEAEEKRRSEWVEEMESHMKDLLESLKRDHPEIFEKIVKHKPRYNIVEETISISDGFDGIGEI